VIYVLVVVSAVYAGKVVSFQEFNTLQACQAAKVYTQEHTSWASKAECFPKGKGL
jgi:hypothetical protein